MRRYPTAALIATLFVLVCQTATPVDTMLAAAESLLATLSPELRQQAVLPFDSEERTNWHYIPRARQGLPLKSMTEPQRRAAANLLRTGLSQSGYNRTETIRALEDILLEMENNPRRDREMYFFTIFGEPRAQGSWGWRYEGHHLSQNWTIVAGKAVATSPQFLGAHPAEVRQGKMAGTRPLAAEEDLAFALLRSLDASQRSVAVIAEQAPRDILTTSTREAARQEDRGLSYADMTAAQRKQLVALIEEHARIQAQPLAEERLARLRAAGLDDIRFAWMGALDRTESGHYYRVQGPTFLIEFDNTQNRANHVHEVWRDFKGDFGRDLLAEHYRKAHK